MKLKSALKSLPVECLEEISRHWGLSNPDTQNGQIKKAQWIDHLYPRMQNASHFEEAANALTPFQKSLLDFMAIHGGILDEKELKKRCFTKAKKAGEKTLPHPKETLDQLEKRGFLFREKWTLPHAKTKQTVAGIPEPFLRFIDLPHVWQAYLGKLLRDAPTPQLKKIANERLNIKGLSNKRDMLLHAIREHLTNPATLRKYIDSLPTDEREILFLVVQRRGVCHYRELLDIIQKQNGNAGRNESVEALLADSGLLFQVTNNPSKYDNLLRVPRDVYHIMTHHFVADDRPIELLDAINQVDEKQPPKTVLDNGISILRDLVILVGYVERHAVKKLGNGGIGKNDLKKVLTRLSANKTLKYAQFLAYYAISQKSLVPTGDYWAIGAEFPEKLKDSRACYLEIYSKWFESIDWNEEYIEGDCIHADTYPANLVHIVELRKLVLSNLCHLPFDTWIDGPRFIESLLALIEVEIPHRGGKATLEKFSRINYLVIESILCESLYWLGLISLGLHEKTDFQKLGCRNQNEDDNATSNGIQAARRLDQHFNFNPRPMLDDRWQFHFQVNGLGRSILAASGENPKRLLDENANIALPFRDDMIHFTVLPNLDIIAPPDLNLLRFFQLRHFAAVKQMDVMSIFSITRESLRAGMDAGLTGEKILEFLKESCPQGLPETVRHLIRECSSRYGEVSLGYAGGYIRVDDPVLAQNIKNNKNIANFIKDVLDDQIILLHRNADIPTVTRELKKLGFMPTVDSENICSTSDGRLFCSLQKDDLAMLLALIEFNLYLEDKLQVDITEDRARPLKHALRPAHHAGLNLDSLVEVLTQGFEKKFETAQKKQINAITNKYRRQMRDLLKTSGKKKSNTHTKEARTASKPKEIRELLHLAIQQEFTVALRYINSSREEIQEKVTPESLNGDKLFAFCEERQAYCAYRIGRIQSAEIQ